MKASFVSSLPSSFLVNLNWACVAVGVKVLLNSLSAGSVATAVSAWPDLVTVTVTLAFMVS